MGTHYKGSAKERLALDVFIKLVRSAASLNSRIYAGLSKEGLTDTQFNALEALYHIGPMNQRELGNKLLKSGGNITMVVDNLEKRDLVKRERGEEDRRYFKILLTDKGEELIERVFPQQLNLIVEEINVLNKKEQKEFQRMCKLIGVKKEE